MTSTTHSYVPKHQAGRGVPPPTPVYKKVSPDFACFWCLCRGERGQVVVVFFSSIGDADS